MSFEKNKIRKKESEKVFFVNPSIKKQLISKQLKK